MTKIGKQKPELDQFLLEGLRLLKIDCDSLARQLLTAKSEEKKRGIVRQLKPILINVTGVKGYGGSSGFSWKVNDREIYRGLAAADLTHCGSAWFLAHEALSHGRFLDALKEYLRAERFFSSARTLAGLEKLHSALARSRADLRHIPTKKTRASAIKFWTDKGNATDSSQEAAGRLYGIIKWPNGEEVPYRTLAKWIAEEKRKLRDTTSKRLPPGKP